MRKEYKAYRKVGKIKNSINEFLELDLNETTVYISPKVIIHIKKRHGRQFPKRFKNNIIDIAEKIIKDPDYIGFSFKTDKSKAIEMVKAIDNIIVVLGIETDVDEEYYYVATMYPITLSKLNTRIYKGRLMKFDNIEQEEDIL